VRQRQRVPLPPLRRPARRARRDPTHIRAGRPQTNGHVENLHKTILDECWRPGLRPQPVPAYTALRRDLVEYLDYYNTDRAHTGRLTRGRIPADIIDPAHKMRPDHDQLSAHLGDSPA
jgi:hypothetical protein